MDQGEVARLVVRKNETLGRKFGGDQYLDFRRDWFILDIKMYISFAERAHNQNCRLRWLLGIRV